MIKKMGGGKISMDDFIAGIIQMADKMAETDVKEEVLKAFKLFDDGDTGKISLGDLQRVASELGEKLSKEELKEMIEEADSDGDGLVDQQDFLKIMKKTKLY